jgi:hypothetical protein
MSTPATFSIADINRVQLVLSGMQNRTFGPYLAAINRTSFHLCREQQHTPHTNAAPASAAALKMPSAVCHISLPCMALCQSVQFEGRVVLLKKKKNTSLRGWAVHVFSWGQESHFSSSLGAWVQSEVQESCWLPPAGRCTCSVSGAGELVFPFFLWHVYSLSDRGAVFFLAARCTCAQVRAHLRSQLNDPEQRDLRVGDNLLHRYQQPRKNAVEARDLRVPGPAAAAITSRLRRLVVLTAIAQMVCCRCRNKRTSPSNRPKWAGQASLQQLQGTHPYSNLPSTLRSRA